MRITSKQKHLKSPKSLHLLQNI